MPAQKMWSESRTTALGRELPILRGRIAVVMILGEQALARDEPVASTRLPWKHAGSGRPNDLIRAERLVLV